MSIWDVNRLAAALLCVGAAAGASVLAARLLVPDTTPARPAILIAGADGPDAAAPGPAPIAERLAHASAERGAVLAATNCGGCHTLEPGGASMVGPNLSGVVDRPVASDGGFQYSDALRSLGGRWSVDRLDRWLLRPQAMAPGTLMGFAGLPDPEARADLIAFLRGQALPAATSPGASAASALPAATSSDASTTTMQTAPSPTASAVASPAMVSPGASTATAPASLAVPSPGTPAAPSAAAPAAPSLAAPPATSPSAPLASASAPAAPSPAPGAASRGASAAAGPAAPGPASPDNAVAPPAAAPGTMSPAAFGWLVERADAKQGAVVAATQCGACHGFDQGGAAQVGPNLFGVYGRPIAQGADFTYSAALSARGGRWTAAALGDWLADPKRFAPGTRMGFAGIADPTTRAAVVAYLRTLRP